MSTMKASVVTTLGKPMEMKDVPIPEPTGRQCLVKIHASGVCHTDVHVNDGDWAVTAKPPVIPGHEGVGEVVKCGSDVTYVKVGDRVGVPWLYTACKSCEHCINGWETVCSKQQCTGFTIDGGFAQYVLADSDFVGKIPTGVTYEQAAPILCAGVTVYKGLKISQVKPGQFVVIVGAAGGLGHVACQYAVAMGMRVIAVDMMDEAKEEMLKGYGVELCVNAKGDVKDAILKYTESGAHGAMMLAPAKVAFEQCVHYLRGRATMVCIALPPGGFNLDIFFTTVKAINVVGSIVGTRTDLQEALDFAGRGKVTCNIECAKFEEVNKIIDDLRKGVVRGRTVLTGIN